MARVDYSKYDFATVLFCDYIVSVLSKPVTIEGSNTPQYTVPYFTVDLIEFEGVEHDIVDFDKDNDKEIVRGLGLLRFRVEGQGGNPMSDLAKLQSSFWTTKFVFEMEQYGFGLSDKGIVIDTKAPLIDARWEERAELKCSFYHSASESFDAEYFNKEEITIVRGPWSETWDGEDPLTTPAAVCQLQ